MTATFQSDNISPRVVVVGRVDADQLWPVATQWRAAVSVGDEFRAPEWALDQAKPVPLSSRNERSLLEAVHNDDGRSVLAQASEPGEHRVSAAVIAALRLASTHPDRSLRFLAWLKDSPDDPRNLRFLRRYLPQLHVFVQLEPDVGVAVPMSKTALGLLSAELLRASGQPDTAAKVLDTLTPSAPVAVALASLRVAAGDFDNALALAADRPVVDDLSAVLRIVHARCLYLRGDADEALTQIAPVLEMSGVLRPIERAALEVRGRALRHTGREVEAGLIESDLGIVSTVTEPRAVAESATGSGAPLFGRSLSDAMDDAWARVRRQPCSSPEAIPIVDPGVIAARTEEVAALIGRRQFEAAESQLLAILDCADASVDAGGPVIDDFFVFLAGMFNQRGMTPEEVATLERQRAAHERAGSMLPDAVEERLVEARGTLDALG